MSKDEVHEARLGRRQFLQAGALATVGVAASGGIARADHVASQCRPEDGHVYRDYTQEALDRAYDQSFWANNIAELEARRARTSEEVRGRLEHFEARYGPSPDETLDVYPARTGALAPIHVFVHGGAWRTGRKEAFGNAAPTFVDAGAHYVALDFSLLPGTPLPEVIAQVRRAIRWLYANAASFGGDRDRIFVSGHSSGGHVAGVLLTTDWRRESLPRDVLKGVICISGMFDLRPVMISSRRSYVVLDAREVRELSAIHHVDRIECPVLLAIGGNESPEFKRQSRAFSRALEEAEHPSTLIVMPHINHFEIPLELEPGGLIARAALLQMGLGC